MRIWVDDVRPAPEGDIWCKSVNDAIAFIVGAENRLKSYIESDMDADNPQVRNARINLRTIRLIDIDYDAGDFAYDGGDYIKLLDWLEETGRNYPIRIHSMNPVGRQNMEAIARRNGWNIIR